ncbi:MAG TPA: response regulator, partial [Geothrix sp.]|nr:response regulator [Geothrix sp.]
MGQRLLLVDSDRMFLKEHQVSLESAFDLDVLSTTEGVLPRLESGAYAAVLICVEVADNKGYALCSTLRKHANLDGVKVALISAKASEEEYRRHQSLKGKADLYLHKPIAPSALVAALAPLVPGRTLDPDNPLGDLVDSELGDDWLDGLKSALDGPAAPPPVPAPAPTPVFGVRHDAPAHTTNLDAKATAPPDTSRLRLLEEQVAALHEELRAKDQKLQAAEAEAQQIQRQLNSVTLNLDELERSNREAETLKARLSETEAALRALETARGQEGESSESMKAQLKEALTERTELIHQVETLNQQVGEKAQRAIELLKERDRLLHENLDLEPFRAKAQELEAALATSQQELKAAKDAQEQLNATIEGLVAQHTTLEGVHQAALLEVAGHKEKAHMLQLEVAGLEATLRGQGRDLAELGDQLRAREAELEVAQARVLERDQQLQGRDEAIQGHQEEIGHLTIRMAALRQEFDEAIIQHEGERLELMNGLDQKEAE